MEQSPVLESFPAEWLDPSAPPLEIDVGCHRGLFLVDMAALFPAHNFLGVERQRERVARTRKKIERLGLGNAAAVQGEGLETLKSLPPGRVDHIHVLFPDPWPKRRHHSRRLVQKEFLDLCATLLKTGGWLRLVTDDEPYAVAMRAAAEGAAQFVREDSDGREYPLTEFQKKFLAINKPEHHLLLRKVS